MLIIRKVDIRDAVICEAIAELNRASFTPGRWAGKLRPERGDWWLATDGHREVGYAGMVPSHRVEKAGYLSAAAVIPEYRGRGIQQRMIRKRIAHARSLGWKWLFTETILDNPASANALINCGFRMFWPAHPWGSPYAVYWRLDL
jgi:GNAT superfamily N-acetyltransferase